MKAKHDQRGFTLLELLVVITIIGMLAAIVFASLTTSRNKGADANIKSDLKNAMAQAQLFYDLGGSSYSGVCALSGTYNVGSMVNAAEKTYNQGTPTVYGNGTASTWNTAQCHDSQGAWAAVVPLRSSVNGATVAWCVDHTGVSKQISTTSVSILTTSGVNQYQCP